MLRIVRALSVHWRYSHVMGSLVLSHLVHRQLHSSAHQVCYEGTLVGEYEVRIYRGVRGPVVILEESASSALPLEYLSEHAVTRFLDAIPSSWVRFFERYEAGGEDMWVEVGLEEGFFFRRPCSMLAVAEALWAVVDAETLEAIGLAGSRNHGSTQWGEADR